MVKRRVYVLVIPAKGLVAKLCFEAAEIATACEAGLAMTKRAGLCHCEEHSDEAISTLATVPKAGIHTLGAMLYLQSADASGWER